MDKTIKRLWPIHISAAVLALGMTALWLAEKAPWYMLVVAAGLLAVLYAEQWYLEKKFPKSSQLFGPIAFLLVISYLILLRLNVTFALKQMVWIVSGAIALALAAWVSWYKNARVQNIRNILILLAGVLSVLALLVAQVDLGGALIFYSIFIIIMYLSTGKRSWAIIGLVVLVAAGLLAYQCFGHVRVRVHTWWDPWSDPQYGGYQLIRSLGAFAAGSWLGTGLGQGQPYLIPAAHTDFIFAVIGEQLGYVGCVIALAAYVYFLCLACRRTIRIPTRGSFLLASGIAFFFIAQSFIIIGGVTKFIPLTGVTLPFLSYGGSSLVTSMGALGILIGLCQKQGEVVAIQERKIRRIRLAAILVAVLLLSNLFYWQIIKGPEVIERMLELI